MDVGIPINTDIMVEVRVWISIAITRSITDYISTRLRTAFVVVKCLSQELTSLHVLPLRECLMRLRIMVGHYGFKAISVLAALCKNGN